MSNCCSSRDVPIAVITGVHPFDVPGFHRLFRALPGIDAYIQDVENFALDWGRCRADYGAAVFYNMHPGAPPSGAAEDALVRMGETGQGIVVLHHAILAWPDWEPWGEITGLPDRGFKYFMDQYLRVDVADDEHPITCGLEAFDLQDETYTMSEPGPDSRVLLTTEHQPSMRALAWTRQYMNSRVFCLQLGHDAKAWQGTNFQQVLTRGILWASERL